ncbi:hypothetical protein CR201_G0055593 [Pongo abelii]|uniref:Uncharacterized protein n=1 Tax=Pongo abelii TaxID=9601 RepID=A0A2J8QZI5_PONAB|nr:hypothetical protein CR201_G0055593 [Pongo abelii]
MPTRKCRKALAGEPTRAMESEGCCDYCKTNDCPRSPRAQGPQCAAPVDLGILAERRGFPRAARETGLGDWAAPACASASSPALLFWDTRCHWGLHHKGL